MLNLGLAAVLVAVTGFVSRALVVWLDALARSAICILYVANETLAITNSVVQLVLGIALMGVLGRHWRIGYRAPIVRQTIHSPMQIIKPNLKVGIESPN